MRVKDKETALRYLYSNRSVIYTMVTEMVSAVNDYDIARFMVEPSRHWTFKQLDDTTATLLRNKRYDIDVLFISENMRLVRVGTCIDINLRGASPYEYSVKWIQAILKETFPSLKVLDVDVARGTDGVLEIYPGLEQIFYAASRTPKGMSALNLRQKGVVKCETQRGHWFTIDRQLVNALELETYNCPVCGKDCLSRGRGMCGDCQETHVKMIDGTYRVKGEIGDDYIETQKGYIKKSVMQAHTCKLCDNTFKNKLRDGVCNECKQRLGREYYHDDYGDIPPGIQPYHSNMGRMVIDPDARFKIGLEVEKQDRKVFDLENRYLEECAIEFGWVTELDGSLNFDSGGVEFISPVYSLSDLSKLESDVNHPKLKKLLNLEVTDSCGGHMHISEENVPPAKLFEEIKGYLPLVYALYAKRAFNNYCAVKETTDYLMEVNHRQAMNVSGKTIEFRIPSAYKDVETIIWRARLAQYMVLNKRSNPIDVIEEVGNRESGLYKLLAERMEDRSIQLKRKAMAEFANVYDKIPMVMKGNEVIVGDPVVVKKEKDKQFKKLVRQASKKYYREKYERGRGRFDQRYDNVPW